MLMLRVVTVTATFVSFLGSAIGVAGQDERPSPSAPASSSVESTAAAQPFVDGQVCVHPDPDFFLSWEASGTTEGHLFNCARSLGLRMSDPDYDAYDFFLMKRTVSKERYSETCDDGGTHIGSLYLASGEDVFYNSEKPGRFATGTFDYSVASTLLDPDTDIWQVEEQGVLLDVHTPEGDWNWTWSVDATVESEGAPEVPVLDKYRGVKDDEFRTLCDYLR